MSRTRNAQRQIRSQRHTRERWLSLALDFLAQDGNAKLTIDRLVDALGVTKGSFYWHFRDRHDFQRSVIEYWDEHFTQVVVERLDEQSTAADRLWAIMQSVFQEDLARYDVAIRAWAAQDTRIAKLVQLTDRKRLRVVRDLFAEIGFEGAELEMRTRCFVTYVSLETGISVKQSKKRRLECLRQLHALLTTDWPVNVTVQPHPRAVTAEHVAAAVR